MNHSAFTDYNNREKIWRLWRFFCFFFADGPSLITAEALIHESETYSLLKREYSFYSFANNEYCFVELPTILKKKTLQSKTAYFSNSSSLKTNLFYQYSLFKYSLIRGRLGKVGKGSFKRNRKKFVKKILEK